MKSRTHVTHYLDECLASEELKQEALELFDKDGITTELKQKLEIIRTIGMQKFKSWELQPTEEATQVADLKAKVEKMTEDEAWEHPDNPPPKDEDLDHHADQMEPAEEDPTSHEFKAPDYNPSGYQDPPRTEGNRHDDDEDVTQAGDEWNPDKQKNWKEQGEDWKE